MTLTATIIQINNIIKINITVKGLKLDQKVERK